QTILAIYRYYSPEWASCAYAYNASLPYSPRRYVDYPSEEILATDAENVNCELTLDRNLYCVWLGTFGEYVGAVAALMDESNGWNQEKFELAVDLLRDYVSDIADSPPGTK